MTDPIKAWLANCPDPLSDPGAGMREVGLLDPCPDYAAIARTKAELVRRTGLLGVGGIWGGRQLVYRHFLAFGTAAQRDQWFGKALAVAISEPEVGAHPKLLTTTADRTDDGFRLSGRKAWVSNGPTADAIIVFAITAQDQGRKRYSAFLVPRDTPGLTIEAMPGFHALRPSRHCLLTLDNCLVPAASMLGEPGSAYDRMALPFRDIEDAVGSFGTIGAIRHATGLFAGLTLDDGRADLGAVVALTAVLAAGAETVVGALDAGRFRTGDATLVGLRLLAIDILERLRVLRGVLAGEGAAVAQQRLTDIIADLDATLSIARGPRMARQAALGETALRP